jgi:hypothetical protein
MALVWIWISTHWPVAAIFRAETFDELEQSLSRDALSPLVGARHVPTGPFSQFAAAEVAVSDDTDAVEAAGQRRDADDLRERVVQGAEILAHRRRGVGED